MSIGNKYASQARYFRLPQPKKKQPTLVRMSNSTAEVVLRERKVEIKDLESQVIYLQNQIKALKVENKTQKDVINRQEKELRKFKEGVADIPSLLRSHKDEIKAFESNATALRRELRECQKDLKTKCDVILRKDQQIEKLTASSKRHEKHLHDISIETKELKTEKKKLDDECKKLSGSNEELKSKSERLQKKVQQMTSKILNLEESLGSSEHHKAQLKEDLTKLQKMYEEIQQSITLPKTPIFVTATATQTENSGDFADLQPSNINSATLVKNDKSMEIGPHKHQQVMNASFQYTCDDSDLLANNSVESGDIPALCHRYQTMTKDAKPFHLKPLRTKSPHTKLDFLPLDSTLETKPYFSFNSPYLSPTLYHSHTVAKNFDHYKNYPKIKS